MSSRGKGFFVVAVFFEANETHEMNVSNHVKPCCSFVALALERSSWNRVPMSLRLCQLLLRSGRESFSAFFLAPLLCLVHTSTHTKCRERARNSSLTNLVLLGFSVTSKMCHFRTCSTHRKGRKESSGRPDQGPDHGVRVGIPSITKRAIHLSDQFMEYFYL